MKEEEHELFPPDKCAFVDFTVLKEIRSWVYNKNCLNKRRIYIVTPDGEMFYKDHKSARPHKRQKYYMSFIFKDGSEKTYRMWRGVFVQIHVAMYKYLDSKKADTLAEANGMIEE